MKQGNLSKWLKIIIVGTVLCLLIVYTLIIPDLGSSLVLNAPEFSNCYIPWLAFIGLTSVPILIALVFAWKIAVNIGRDHSFSIENSNYLKWISWLAIIDSAYFFIGNLVLMLLNMNHAGIMLVSLIAVFIGIAVSVASAALSLSLIHI